MHCIIRSVDVGHAARLLSRLDDELAGAVGPATAAHLRRALGGQAGAGDFVVEAHGTIVGYAPPPGGPRRRALELDRHGAPLCALRWSADTLAAAWVRIADRSWLRIEPRAAADAPWGLSDRVWHAERVGAAGTPLTVYDALDYAGIDRIPTLAEPGRLPPSGGIAVLNLIAALAADQRRTGIAYGGPYPTEQLFLALLESFRYETSTDDPLAAFMDLSLAWRPAPHERVFTPEGAYVQLRGRIEKVVWRGRPYYRPDWEGIARHAPRRVRDVEDRVRCSLWVLGGPVADHLELTREGEVTRLAEDAPPASGTRPLADAVAGGIGAVVAATSAAPLAPFIRADAQELALEWGPVPGDLLEVRGNGARVSTRVRERLRELLREAQSPPQEAATALAALSEIALLLADALRARAQARVAALGEAEQRARLSSTTLPAAGTDARAITTAVEALLADAAS